MLNDLFEIQESIFLGTGKTRTFVAAISEIVSATNKSILVCAQSNTACDEIALRLMKVLRDGELFRMYAKSHDKNLINTKIKPISNLKGNVIHFPSLEHIYQFRVVVCIFFTSAYFSSVRKEKYFDPAHFSYVFIDEAACCQEIFSMIPIAGVCTEPKKIHGRIVLAGDPKQLDAVVKSEFASDLGFKRSFMEFLFEKKCYQRNLMTAEYNPNFIVQLTKNYRSHPAILHTPNKLFYEGKLECLAPAGCYKLLF